LVPPIIPSLVIRLQQSGEKKTMKNASYLVDCPTYWSCKNCLKTGRAANGNSRLTVGLSFLLGLILCQNVCGRQLEPSPTKRQPKDFTAQQAEQPEETQGLEQATAGMLLADLGGQSGFGSGVTIGSGVAEIVIKEEETEEAQSLTHFPATADSLKPVEAKMIPQKAPLPASLRKPQELVVPTEANPAIDCPPVQPNFGMRQRGMLAPIQVVPQPLVIGPIYDPECRINPWNPYPRRDELVFNGGDQGKRATVDSSWNLYDVNPQDTIGHFDTLDGRRLVTPSNQVAIYAPRFAAVRKLDGLINYEARLKVGSMDEKKVLSLSESKDFSSTTKQYEGIDGFRGSKRASAFRETTRGINQDNTIQLLGARNVFEPFENLSLFRLGMHQKSEGARLGLGMQSANVWQDNLGLQVNVKGAKPIIVNDVYKIQQIVQIDSDDNAILRVCKVASKISARPGEPVDFSIRFDNLTGRTIGNVTIVDNLTGRLEYIADSAECSLKSNFSFETNEEGSLVLRWEIIDPLAANTGGIIRFRCRVR
jgi:uncharacterized repeat protein (TIGR01451 family)